MKTMYRVRELGAPFNLGGGFRDELVATAMALSLLVFGSFVMAAVIFEEEPSETEAIAVAESDPQTLGISDNESAVINLLPSPTAEPVVAVATDGAVVAPVVPFGEDGEYDFSAYTISFANPRLVFDAAKQSGRKLVVEVALTNKTVIEGLDSRIFASIVKDGVVIVPKAAMHVPNRQTVATGQQVLFQAEITLVEATDARELRFEPGGDIPTASHFLYQ